MVSAVFRQEHCDALNGLFKVGMSKAASSLTELINNEVALTISSLTAVGFDLGLASLNQISIRNFNAVGQSFNGEFVGSAFLFFNNESSLDLIHSILEKEGWTKELGEMEQEALKEISNIILNACLGYISDTFECELQSNLPDLITGNINEVFDIERMHIGAAPLMLNVTMTFKLPNKQIKGQMSLIMANESIKRLIIELERSIMQSVF